MIQCAIDKKAGLVIVTRDSDYGVTVEKKSYINDHLRQEFSERVSRKRSLLLYPLLSDALKLFKVQVSQKEEEAETELVSNALGHGASGTAVSTSNLARWLSDTYQATYNIGNLKELLEYFGQRTPGTTEESSE
jgi:hypothetical protein